MKLIDADIFVNKMMFYLGDTKIGRMVIGIVRAFPAIDAVPVVRCGDCANYKKRHVLTNDGQEKSYEEMPEEAFGGLNDGYVTHEYGINVGGKCMLDCGRGYPVDKSVFRSPNDFCSYGLKMDGDPHDSC